MKKRREIPLREDCVIIILDGVEKISICGVLSRGDSWAYYMYSCDPLRNTAPRSLRYLYVYVFT